MKAAEPARRRYDSARRLEQAVQTRAAVVNAAGRLFGENGWAGTGMRDVARAAGVAVETVYANFGSKAELLMAAVDVAVVGDAEAIPLAERPGFAALGRGPRAERARAAAALTGGINERTYKPWKALREGAGADHELAKRLSEGQQRRRVDVERAARLVAARPVSETERDGLWAVVGTEVYELLVEQAGWSQARYEKWLADSVIRLLQPRKERA